MAQISGTAITAATVSYQITIVCVCAPDWKWTCILTISFIGCASCNLPIIQFGAAAVARPPGERGLSLDQWYDLALVGEKTELSLVSVSLAGIEYAELADHILLGATSSLFPYHASVTGNHAIEHSNTVGGWGFVWTAVVQGHWHYDLVRCWCWCCELVIYLMILTR
jgi:hypothetical protein